MLDEPILSKTACQSTKMVVRETICKLNKLLLQPGSNNMTPSLDAAADSARQLRDPVRPTHRTHVEPKIVTWIARCHE